MSPVDTETPTEPLTRMLAAIRASQFKAQYTCKRYERGEEGEGKREEKEGEDERKEKERERESKRERTNE
jgi:hypothetical protein